MAAICDNCNGMLERGRVGNAQMKKRIVKRALRTANPRGRILHSGKFATRGQISSRFWSAKSNLHIRMGSIRPRERAPPQSVEADTG